MLGIKMGRMQARIHRVTAPDEPRQEPTAWIDLAGPGEDQLRERLRALAGRSDALLHLDYHPLNVMTDGRRVTGVLDWANARPGDPRADYARTVTILRLAPAPPGASRPFITIWRRVLKLGWRRGYRQIGGQLNGLAPFYAWAGALMVRDLAPKLGHRGVWLTPRDLDRFRQWTAVWRRRAGIESSP